MTLYVPAVGTITSVLSENEVAFGVRINAVLVAAGPMTIVNGHYRLVPAGNGRVHQFTITGYSVGQTYGAVVVQANQGQDLDMVLATWAAANPTLIPQQVYDLSPVDPRLDLSQSLLVLYTTLPNFICPLVLRNTGLAILSGAEGSLAVLGSAGLTGRVITGRNMVDTAWAGGEEGYGVWDARSGEWLCCKNCC